MGTTDKERQEILRQRREKNDQNGREIDRQITRLEHKQMEEKRKADTRRKIMIGAVIMPEMEARPDKIGAWVMSLLDKKLWKPQDRKLFGLAPLEQSSRPGPVAKIGVGTLAAGDDGPAILPFELHCMEAPNACQPSRPDGSQPSRTAQEKPTLKR